MIQNTTQKTFWAKFKVGIIGAGVMGQVIIDRLLKTKALSKSQILISRRFDDKKILIDRAQIIILAVKPQDFRSLAQELKTAGVNKSQLIISIMAGVDIKIIQKLLGASAVVRAMPNLPAKIGQGITVWKPSAEVSQRQKIQIKRILQTLGVEIEIKQERVIDLATAVSGSGPAYIFLFQELLQEAGASLGLSKELSRQLTAQTFWGAVNLQRELGIDPKILREQVTSKAGTTAAALQVFGEHQLSKIFIQALKAASKRGVELKKTL